nr:uncharacterized protein LOC113725006 [Coffea arabica]
MPVAKLSTGGTLDSMKSGDGNDSLDTVSRQTVGKEPHISLSRTGDIPVPWFQLLHELPGWPLLKPLKVQMEKCEKCAQEFCSPVNYRRHIRVHRRSLNFDKESHKIRDMLAAFWDKLSLEDAKEVVSLRDVTLKEVTGTSVIKSLAASLHKPGVWTLPQVYVEAGSTLLDVIHAKSSRLPISSQELFSILDDASERTFLRAGTAESVLKYIFGGKPGRIAFELKNLVACTSFLFELKLVKAWVADKDVEALRCQKLLVEEEEAAQKRQAELLERKKQKKLRQKEQKAREHSNGDGVALIDATSSEGSFLAEMCSSSPPDSSPDAPCTVDDGTTFLKPVQLSSTEQNNDIEAQSDLSSGHLDSGLVQNVEPTMVSVNGRRWRQVSKSHWAGRSDFHGNQNHQVSKLEPVQKLVPAKDRGTVVSSSKVWTKKLKVDNDEEILRPTLEEAVNQSDENKCELIIGSISIPVTNCILRKNKISLGEAHYSCSTEEGKHKSNVLEEPANSDSRQFGLNEAATELRMPKSLHGSRGPSPVQRANHDAQDGVMVDKLEDRTASDGSCLQSSSSDDDHSQSREGLTCVYEGMAMPQGLQLSTAAAKAFLAQRWKEAISAEHVMTLVLSEESDLPGLPENQIDISALDFENGQVDLGRISSTGGITKAKNRTNPEKGVKIKYIPKQKVAS